MPAGPVLRTMSVSTAPGARALTRMPLRACSAAIERVSDSSADLPDTYIATIAPLVNTPVLTTLTTAAWGLSTRWGKAYWKRNSGPRTLTS